MNLPLAQIWLEYIAFTDALSSIELDQVLFRLLIKIHGVSGIEKGRKAKRQAKPDEVITKIISNADLSGVDYIVRLEDDEG